MERNNMETTTILLVSFIVSLLFSAIGLNFIERKERIKMLVQFGMWIATISLTMLIFLSNY